MTDFPDLKMKAVVQFPARIDGGAGIDVTKSNGTYQFDLAFSDFAPPVTGLTDPENQSALLWNSVTGQYDLIPASILTGSGVFPATELPLIESGSGAVGSSNKYAREDHVHPVSGNTFLQSGFGAAVRTPQDKMREIISVKDFGAVGDGVADDTAAISAAWTACQARAALAELVFPEGIYKASAFPNFAYDYAMITARGKVTLRCTGIGGVAIDSGGSAPLGTGVTAMVFGRFNIEAPSSATAFRVNGVHHSFIEAEVRSVAAAGIGAVTEFCVCTEFKINVTTPTGPAGIGLTVGSGSDPDYPTCWCTFYNTIVEGVGTGIQFGNAMGNLFIGGTSEGNTRGILFDTPSFNNRVIGLDFEVNSGDDIYLHGVSNSVIDCDTGIGSGAPGINVVGSFCEVRGGTHRGIVNNGTRTKLEGFTYNKTNDGSLFTDNQSVSSIRRDLFNRGTSAVLDGFVTWTAYTPTVTAGSGTFTSVSATGRYLTVGKTTFVNITITITTNGTAAGYVAATLPKAVATATVISGRTSTNLGLVVIAASSEVDVIKYDSTYPGASGMSIFIGGMYENT